MIDVIFRNGDYAVIDKPVGMESEREVPAVLEEEGISGAKCFHRLDREVGGLMLLTLSDRAASAFSGAEIEKIYTAVVRGTPDPLCGEMKDLLYHDPVSNKTFVVHRMRAGVKEAVLKYETLGTNAGTSTVRVKLITGRTHQIRVQFAWRGMPLCGDGRYGGGKGKPMLYSSRLSFTDPFTGEKMTFEKHPLFAEDIKI